MKLKNTVTVGPMTVNTLISHSIWMVARIFICTGLMDSISPVQVLYFSSQLFCTQLLSWNQRHMSCKQYRLHCLTELNAKPACQFLQYYLHLLIIARSSSSVWCSLAPYSLQLQSFPDTVLVHLNFFLHRLFNGSKCWYLCWIPFFYF